MLGSASLKNRVILEDHKEDRTDGMLLSKSLCERPPKSQAEGWDAAHRASVCSAQRPGLAIAGEREDMKSKRGIFVTYNAHSYVMEEN